MDMVRDQIKSMFMTTKNTQVQNRKSKIHLIKTRILMYYKFCQTDFENTYAYNCIHMETFPFNIHVHTYPILYVYWGSGLKFFIQQLSKCTYA